MATSMVYSSNCYKKIHNLLHALITLTEAFHYTLIKHHTVSYKHTCLIVTVATVNSRLVPPPWVHRIQRNQHKIKGAVRLHPPDSSSILANMGFRGNSAILMPRGSVRRQSLSRPVSRTEEVRRLHRCAADEKKR